MQSVNPTLPFHYGSLVSPHLLSSSTSHHSLNFCAFAHSLSGPPSILPSSCCYLLINPHFLFRGILESFVSWCLDLGLSNLSSTPLPIFSLKHISDRVILCLQWLLFPFGIKVRVLHESWVTFMAWPNLSNIQGAQKYWWTECLDQKVPCTTRPSWDSTQLLSWEREPQPWGFGALWVMVRFWILFSLSLERKWQPTPVLLPGKFRGRRSLGYSPWGRKESDMTEWLHFTSLLFVMVTHWKVLRRGYESVDLHVLSVLKSSPQSGDGGGGNIEAEFRDWSQVPWWE